MSENKTGKYLKYAIGEIILVVIGILIALQINNWNERKKVNTKELEVLADFKKSLEFDILQIDSLITQYDRAKFSLNKVLNHLENDLPYSDSLESHFFNTTLIYDSGGLTDGVFETLKSSGFDLISNKEIRDLIILVYDELNQWMKDWEKRYFDELFKAHNHIYISRFEDFWKGDYKDRSIIGTMKPRDYEKLKNDIKYKYHIKTQINLIGWLVSKPAEDTQKHCVKLLELINQELKIKSND